MFYTVIKDDGHLRTIGNENEFTQMSGVFYHSVIHGLSFFVCFII